MKYRRLTDGGDYMFGRNNQDILSDVDAVMQIVSTRLKLLQGEWWENIQNGFPLYQSILGQTGMPDNLAAIDLVIKDYIMNTPEVTDILSFSSTLIKRVYSYQCTIMTSYGSAPIGGTL